MGTDRTEEARGPCPCGQGEVVVERCTADHPFASADHWWQSRIDCPNCAKGYEVEDDDPGQAPKLVLKTEVAKRQSWTQAWHQQRKTIMGLPAVHLLLKQLASRLDQEKSLAAKYRLLAQHHLASSALATFRKRFTDSSSYAHNLSPTELPGVMDLLGVSDPAITAALQKLQQLWAEMKKPLPAVATGIAGLAA